MSKLTYTSDELLDRVRKKGGWTDSDQLGAENPDLLRAMNEAMFTELLPRLMKVREGYFEITRRVPLTANENRYRIPKQAAGQKLRDLYWIDSTGERHRLPHISRENRELYATTGTEPEAYFLEGSHIVLVPDLTGASGQLELAYFFRPGQLVLELAARQVLTITPSGGSIRLGISSLPVVSPGWSVSRPFDIHSQDSGAEIRAFEITADEVTSGYVSFPASSVDGSQYGCDAVQVGDWINLAGEAAVPAVPLEMHPILVQATVVRMAEGIGDETYQYHKAELDRMLQAAAYLYDSRVEGQPKKLVPRDGWALYGGGPRRRIW